MKSAGQTVAILIFILITSMAQVQAEDPRDADSPYGVLAFLSWDHDWNDYHFHTVEDITRAADLIKKAGIKMVRMDFLWADVEPEKGHFDFQRYERIVKILRDRDISILGLLEYNPSWRGGSFNDAPEQISYIHYARQVVRHFKKDVMFWEIWNEPDHQVYWQPQDDMTAYSQLLAAVTPAIKQEDPTAKVLMGGLAQEYPFKLRSIYKKAGKDSFDIVNIHPFVDPLKENHLETLKGIVTSVHRVMEEFGDDKKPIWFTEVGCPGVITPEANNTWWLGKSPTEEEQASWLMELYEEGLAMPGVERIFWAFLRDTGSHFGNGVDSFGLLHQDFSPKPAYNAYSDLTRQNPNK